MLLRPLTAGLRFGADPQLDKHIELFKRVRVQKHFKALARCQLTTGMLGLNAPLATVPCDTPFLPTDLVAQLTCRAQPDKSVYACDARRHYLCALGPTSTLETLRAKARTSFRLSDIHLALKGQGPAVRAALHAFRNINSREDALAAEAIVRQECVRDA